VAKNNDWFDWFDQKNEAFMVWAMNYFADKGIFHENRMTLTQWIKNENAVLNCKPQDLVRRKFRDNMWQAFKTDLKRKQPGKKPCSYILNTSASLQLKRVAKRLDMPMNQTLEKLVNYADIGSETILEEIRNTREDQIKNQVRKARVKKSLDDIRIKSLENTVSVSERKIAFLRERIESLYYVAIKNRDLIEMHKFEMDPLSEDESSKISARVSARMKSLDEEMGHELNLKFPSTPSDQTSEN
jgi:hypothetical protein